MPAILLLTDDPRQRQRWAEALAPLSAQVYGGWSEAPRDALIDVVVTDQPFNAESLSGPGHLLPQPDIAVVAVAAPLPADVSPAVDVLLPHDFAPRELLVACRLLGEIVRLRRERKEGAQTQHALRQLALTDPLTGLANLRAWDEQLTHKFLVAQRERRTLCIAVFDVDRFKLVNDQYGHAVGDALLRSVGSQLAAAVRPGDQVARLGGDEFGLLVLGIAPQDASALVERVRHSLRQAPTADRASEVTASAGWAFFSAEKELATPEALYQAADSALRRAKAEGRDRTVSFHHGDAQ